MKISSISIKHPSNKYELNPELLASVSGRYSRSNLGLDSIMKLIDNNNIEKSIDKILSFVDFGHGSIYELTGGIPIVIDNISMLLAYTIFQYSQLASGMESSTRYIRMSKENVTEVSYLFDESISNINNYSSHIENSFNLYDECYNIMNEKIKLNSDIIIKRDNISEKMKERFIKNYALDRVRYFIPLATKTNMVVIMNARAFCETIKMIDSYDIKEFNECANLIRLELEKFVPRMIKHSFPTNSSKTQIHLKTLQMFDKIIKHSDSYCINTEDKIDLQIMRGFADDNMFLTSAMGKENRYCAYGDEFKRTSINVRWNNMSVAELRDMNRSRVGFRTSYLAPIGFYIPDDLLDSINNNGDMKLRVDNYIKNQHNIIVDFAKNENLDYLYYLTLGNQVGFEHTQTLDKYLYSTELRTGLGAHFRYCDHYTKAFKKLLECKEFSQEEKQYLKDNIDIGAAEPEL